MKTFSNYITVLILLTSNLAMGSVCSAVASLGKNDALYFGVESKSNVGHYYFYRDGRRMLEPNNIKDSFLPESLGYYGLIDGGFCLKKGVQGHALIHFIEGWTVLSFWDSSGDSRPGSNSNFVIKGRHSFNEMVEISKALFPTIWQRFTFEVSLSGPDLTSNSP